MHFDTLKALQESIEHWRRLATGHFQAQESVFYEDCALCHRFGEECTRGEIEVEDGKEYYVNPEFCPVFDAVGAPDCKSTPWVAVHDFLIYQHRILQPSALPPHAIPEFLSLCRAHLDFLISLLPPEQP